MTITKVKKRLKVDSLISAVERNILKWMQEGKTNEEIGKIIGLTKWTIKYHLKNIMQKLDVTNRTQAVSQAISQGLLPPIKAQGTDDPPPQKIKVGIVCHENSENDLLKLFTEDPYIEIAGITDMDPFSSSFKLARDMNIPVSIDVKAIIENGADVIINLTDSKEVSEKIKGAKPPTVELLDNLSSKLLCHFAEERRKRIKDRERVLKEHEALYHLGLVIENIGSIKDACLAIIDYATKLTSTPAGSVILFNEKSEELIVAATKGFSESFQKIDRWEMPKGGLIGHILNQNSPLVVTDMRDYPEPNQYLIKEGVRAFMASTLAVEGRIIGLLYVNDFKKRQFRTEDVSLFSLLTVYAALTVERVKSIEEMKTLSITDGLTKLYNHRYLMEQMYKEFQRASRHKHRLSIVMIDIDHFKKYNDEFGHLEGNNVLKGLAKVFMNTVRVTDIVGRFGGEEFCVILPEMDKKGAAAFAKRLLREVSDVSFNKKVTLSCGVAVFPDDEKTPLELIKKADAYLYRAKKNGRNQVCC
ncbi:MAG: diguanylate cyclase [Deltaproteobacteria bacterium]|nr:diguanylate cyclase [Deltaproteobacteria bacterium]